MASQYPRGIQAALGTLREHMTSFGYLPADVPIIQPADYFLTRAGDQILHRLFTFERRGISLALRPEFTTPALRRYIAEQGAENAAVARWQVAGIIFEDDPSDGSMSFERPSSGAECIGLRGAGAEAEIIAMAATGCAKLQHPVTSIILGDARFLRSVLASQGIDVRLQRFILSHMTALSDPQRGVDYILERFDAQVSPLGSSGVLKSDTAEQEFRAILEINDRGRAMGGRTQADVARRLVQRQQRASQREPLRAVLLLLSELAQVRGRPSEVLPMMAQVQGNDLWQSAFANWKHVIHLLGAYGYPEDNILLVPLLARDWEYYSGLTFELFADDGTHVAGGGRYDEFARLIGSAEDIPAVGFTYYLDALLTSPVELNNGVVWELQADAADARGIAWAQALRRCNVHVKLQPTEGNPSRLLSLNTEGTLTYAENSYTPAQINDLITALNGRL